MARPGFNGTHFYDLTFDEMTILGWIGQHSCGDVDIEEFKTHCAHYMPRIFEIIKMDLVEGNKKVEPLLTSDGLKSAFTALNKKTNFFKSFEVSSNRLKFDLNFDNLSREIDFLKNKGISSIITLTEKHHQADRLSEHFDVHHFSIPDMHAPTIGQAEAAAQIISRARAKNEKVAVHCLAGIGRTSTMIMAAHVLLGEDLKDLKAEILRINPSFKFVGPQTKFLDEIQERASHFR